jgi:outer membrane receptor protein involved in Fe transport
VNTTAGYNSNSTFNSFTTYSGSKTDFLGFDDGTRDIPGNINDTRVVRGNYSTDELQNIGLSFKNNWNTSSKNAPINGSMKITLGDKFALGDDNLFGYIASYDYSSTSVISDRQKNFYDFDGARYLYSGVGNVNSVMMSGLLNLSFKFSGSNKISFKNVFNQNSDDETTIYNGDYRYADQYREITSLRFVSRTLNSHQLVGEHFFNLMNGFTWDWGVSYSRSLRNEPDARRYVYFRGLDDPNDPLVFLLDQSLTTRFYSDLEDNDYNFTTNFSIKPFVDPTLPKFSFGALYNKKDRNFDARIFGFRNNFLPGYNFNKDSILALSVDRIFQPENISPGFITINEITKPSDNYTSFQKVGAGYAMFDTNILNSFRLVAGARYEYSEQNMNSATITNEPVLVNDYYRDWLPSINLTYLLNETIDIRFAFTKTLARPEFREKAPFQYFDFVANELVEGNPDLKRALITNYDLRFEMFPGAGELLAVSFFYKRFNNPIELILIASSSNEPIRSYQNAQSADNIGAELELRKNLGFVGNVFTNFSLVTNISVISSEIKLNDVDNGFQENNRPLQGQAPYIFNIGLYYDNFESGWNATAAYNKVGARISKVGYADLGDIVEQPVDLIDLSVSKRIFEYFTVKLSAMDILNQNKNFIQRTPDGDKISESYNNGRTFKIGINYQL